MGAVIEVVVGVTERLMVEIGKGFAPNAHYSLT